jgi:hypothetical protein
LFVERDIDAEYQLVNQHASVAVAIADARLRQAGRCPSEAGARDRNGKLARGTARQRAVVTATTGAMFTWA